MKTVIPDFDPKGEMDNDDFFGDMFSLVNKMVDSHNSLSKMHMEAAVMENDERAVALQREDLSDEHRKMLIQKSNETVKSMDEIARNNVLGNILLLGAGLLVIGLYFA